MKQIPTRRCIDVHEMLVAEIRKPGNDSSYSESTFPSRATSAPAGVVSVIGFEDISLYFDSTQRDVSSDLSIGEIRWSISQLNNSNQIRSYVQISVGEFYFPNRLFASTVPAWLYYSKVYMEILGAPSSQSTQGPNGTRFHFEFNVDTTSAHAVRLTPVNHSHYFSTPVTDMSEFYVRFYAPSITTGALTRLNIPLDKASATIVPSSSPARFIIADTSIIGPIGILSPGVVVTATASGNSVFDAAMATGAFVTNIISATQFEVGTLIAPAVVQPVTVNVPKNRIAIRAVFTCARSSPTNYITPVHL